VVIMIAILHSANREPKRPLHHAALLGEQCTINEKHTLYAN